MGKFLKLNKKQKVLLLIGIILGVLAFLIMRFASFRTTINGRSTLRTGKPILETQVTAFEPGDGQINPYCIVKVRNYNNDHQISQVEIEYEMVVEPAEEGDELPEYYWSTTDGDELGVELRGQLGIEEEEEQIYKLVFVNASEEDTTQNVKITAQAVQK